MAHFTARGNTVGLHTLKSYMSKLSGSTAAELPSLYGIAIAAVCLLSKQ